MLTIHYRLNNNKTFNFYQFIEDITQKELGNLHKKFQTYNGKDAKIKLFVADDKLRIVMTSEKFDKKDIEIIGKMNYTFKRGFDYGA